ncbi:MAG: isochorismatase family cysteine hydrolase [Methanomassiliicoccales archaeon]
MIALLIVDMINAFVNSESPLCVRGAKETVPRIRRVADECRKRGVPVFFVTRGYREDGSDVEVSRWKYWSEHGRPLTLDSKGKSSGEFYGSLKPKKGDYVILKKKWSAFFRTELDLILRKLNVDTVVITGTQTPNCIRATAFDADMNDFGTVIIEDCVSSNTEDVQQANLKDFRNVGFTVLNSYEFIDRLDAFINGKSIIDAIKEDIAKQRNQTSSSRTRNLRAREKPLEVPAQRK